MCIECLYASSTSAHVTTLYTANLCEHFWSLDQGIEFEKPGWAGKHGGKQGGVVRQMRCPRFGTRFAFSVGFSFRYVGWLDALLKTDMETRTGLQMSGTLSYNMIFPFGFLTIQTYHINYWGWTVTEPFAPQVEMVAVGCKAHQAWKRCWGLKWTLARCWICLWLLRPYGAGIWDSKSDSKHVNENRFGNIGWFEPLDTSAIPTSTCAHQSHFFLMAAFLWRMGPTHRHTVQLWPGCQGSTQQSAKPGTQAGRYHPIFLQSVQQLYTYVKGVWVLESCRRRNRFI